MTVRVRTSLGLMKVCVSAELAADIPRVPLARSSISWAMTRYIFLA